MNIDERIHTIIKETALSEPFGDDCPWCGAHETEQIPNTTLWRTKHKSECLIVLARQVLQEWRTPVNVYKVTYETPWRDEPRKVFTMYALALTEEEAKAQHRYGEHSDIQATFIQTFPIQDEA